MTIDLSADINQELRENVWLKLHTTVTVGTKWQVVIPLEVREMLNIVPWDSLMVITKDWIAIWMIKTDNINDLMEYMQKEHCKNN